MQTIECWRLKVRDRSDLVVRFTSREAAEEVRDGSGYKPAICTETITIYDNAVEFDPVRFDTVSRESGLSKLTDAEKVALGLLRKV